MPMYIIGIAGGTGSGKTTVARKIIESLPKGEVALIPCLLYTSPSPRDGATSRMPSSA